MDIGKYSGAQYIRARTICYLFMDLLDTMDNTQQKQLLDFMCHTKLTAIMELLDPAHMRVEDLSLLEGPKLKFIAWTSCDLSENFKSLCCFPPHIGIDIADSMGK